MAISVLLLSFLISLRLVLSCDKCVKSSVIWKCCPLGEQFVNKLCQNVSDNNDSSLIQALKLPLPLNLTVRSNFCDVSKKIWFAMDENLERFSVQWNNKLYYRREFLDDFCVDYNLDIGGLRVLVCENEMTEHYGSSINSFGKYLTDSKKILSILVLLEILMNKLPW